ncbi:MAG: PEP-CTERM/exosortase system-associated acyltransferase [Candidatus Thiodiazotropha sp.]|jgi:N-acyl amino acid synthase of PEP-CTERM/exosortase system
MESLADNFFRYFISRYAASHHQKQISYSIRHQVYAEELGWEPISHRQLETDQFDDYAHPCLLEHKRTGDIAGCVRLVVPQTERLDIYHPYQQHPIEDINTHHIGQLSPTEIGEISRLAVPNQFRRRANEQGKPFIFEHGSSKTVFNEDEQRNFPHIAIGLYLSAIAMVELCDLELVLVVMEPRLMRHLKRFGICFHQISATFDFNGERALFELPRSELTLHLKSQVKELYQLILMSLMHQPWHEHQINIQAS